MDSLLVRLGFVALPCCVFAGLRVIVRRRLTDPSHGPTIIHYHIICAPQQTSLSGRTGGSAELARQLLVEKVSGDLTDVYYSMNSGKAIKPPPT